MCSCQQWEEGSVSIFLVKGKQTKRPEDWKWLLREPEKQWKQGFSAWALAHCWEEVQGFPVEVHELVTSVFREIQIAKAIVEHKVSMPPAGSRGPSQNDLFVYASDNAEKICIAIEGKCSEDFSQTVDQWHTGKPVLEKRLSGILEIIGLPRDIPTSIRYQLLHRMASPVIEAQKNYPAEHAVMVIHSFSQSDEHFDDFDAFLNLYGIHDARVGELYYLTTVNGVKLYAGWARGNKRFIGEE